MKKKLMFLILAITLVVIRIGLSPTMAMESTQLSGHTFQAAGCDVIFQSGPFGPGENGVATVKCSADVSIFKYVYDHPLLQLYQDAAGQSGIYRFVMVGSTLYLFDPSYLVMVPVE